MLCARNASVPDHLTGIFHGYYGKCLIELGQYEEAEQQLITGVSLLEEALGAEHERTAVVINFLIDLYEAWGKPDKAAHYRAMLPEPEKQAQSP